MSIEEAPSAKVLVISPAGEVYSQDCVRWYSSFPYKQILENYFNIGDMIVYDSTLKMLKYDQVTPLEISCYNEEEINKVVSEKYDYIIVRASNFIHNHMDWLQSTKVLEKIKLPVYAIGVGAQSGDGGIYALEGENLRFWKIVSERSQVIGVRGTFTADVLAASGIKNVEIVGCPSMFRARERNLDIKAPAKLENLAFSIRREAGAGYTTDVGSYRESQRNFLLRATQQFNVTITVHGEPEEKYFFFKDYEKMKAARGTFRHEKWWTPETEARMEELYRKNLFFFLDVAAYDDFVKEQDFAVGYRVHGVLPALANGIPGAIVCYDSRSTELANTHAIPSINAKDVDRADISKLAMETDYSDFNRVHAMRYDKMKFVLEQNKIPHRL